ncbi:SapC family protein [bacterium]|nr:SapC family protein [bacterium]
MAKFVMLNQQEHADIKVIDERSAAYGDNVMYAMTFPFEFRNIQGSYPIFFQKNAETGAFFPIALFGFQEAENLFLDDSGWHASYVPLLIRRQPFVIGFQEDAQAENNKKAVISIDMDSPRVNTESGHALFENGGMSEFLSQMNTNLEMINAAHEHNDKFIKAITELELIEQFTLDVPLKDGSTNQLLGLYTINEDKLQGLTGEQMQQLNSEGFLMPLFMVLASHSCIRTLVEKKNEQVA